MAIFGEVNRFTYALVNAFTCERTAFAGPFPFLSQPEGEPIRVLLGYKAQAAAVALSQKVV